MSAQVSLNYTNYRGETSLRTIIPKSIRCGTSEWHPEAQLLLTAFDVDKQAEREFAMKDFAGEKLMKLLLLVAGLVTPAQVAAHERLGLRGERRLKPPFALMRNIRPSHPDERPSCREDLLFAHRLIVGACPRFNPAYQTDLCRVSGFD